MFYKNINKNLIHTSIELISKCLGLNRNRKSAPWGCEGTSGYRTGMVKHQTRPFIMLYGPVDDIGTSIGIVNRFQEQFAILRND